MTAHRYSGRRLVWMITFAVWATATVAWFVLPRSPGAVQIDASAIITGHEAALFNDRGSPAAGSAAPTAVVVEFFDYNCAHCRRMEPVIRSALKADDRLRIIYKEFPFLSPGSLFAAAAALAAQRQGKYLALHTAMMEAEGDITERVVLRIAAKVGVDVERLKSDMKDPGIEAALDRNFRLARDLGISQTPTLIVGRTLLKGTTDLEALQELVRRSRTRNTHLNERNRNASLARRE